MIVVGFWFRLVHRYGSVYWSSGCIFCFFCFPSFDLVKSDVSGSVAVGHVRTASLSIYHRTFERVSFKR